MALLNTNVPELTGSDTALCLHNLELLGDRRERISESMLAVLSELADAIIRDGDGDPDTVDSILLSLRGTEDEGEDRVGSRVAPVNRDVVSRSARAMGVNLRLILYRFITERLPAARQKAPPSPVAEAASGRIAYMAGAFADKAYDCFARLIPHARASAFHSFVDACEEVRGGLCEYGILPLENTQSGKLTAFSRLILRYDLQVVAVTDLKNGAEAGQVTRFALLKQADEDSLTILPSPPLGSPTRRYIELLHTTSTPSLTELLEAAAFCGLVPVRLDTLPVFEELAFLYHEAADGGVPPVCCVFDITDADIATFSRFLALEAPEDILMGRYGIL